MVTKLNHELEKVNCHIKPLSKNPILIIPVIFFIDIYQKQTNNQINSFDKLSLYILYFPSLFIKYYPIICHTGYKGHNSNIICLLTQA